MSELALDSLRITVLASHIQAMQGSVMTAEDLLELLDASRVADVVAIVRRVTNRPATL